MKKCASTKKHLPNLQPDRFGKFNPIDFAPTEFAPSEFKKKAPTEFENLHPANLEIKKRGKSISLLPLIFLDF